MTPEIGTSPALILITRWLFATAKDGISALSLQRSLEIGSYQTAWAMLGRLRSVLVRPGPDRLAGTVEVDETYIGGEEAGLRGGRAPGKKVLTGIAVQVTEPKGIGRCSMALLADGSSASLHPFVTGHVEPGATVITDAWMGYPGWPGSATSTSGAVSGPPAPAAKTRRAAARRAPGRLDGQAVAAEHPPRLG
jgi:ISXO2-like transposase domain